MLDIAAVIITRNEEARMHKVLSSVQGLVREIIVVDDMSTDRTCAIAREEFGARVFQRPLAGDFAAQRNFGAEQASCAWVLPLDADEEVPSATALRIKEALASAGDTAGFELRRLNYFVGKPIRHAGAYSFSMRLYRRDMARFVGSVHEHLSIDGPIARIEGDICHYPFETVTPMFEKAITYGAHEAEIYCARNRTISVQEVRYQLTWRPLKTFWKLYFKKQGYKDGLHGLVWCICNVVGPLIKWVKIWEMAHKAGSLAP